VLIYDGDCAPCARGADWLQAHLATPITVLPWQQVYALPELEVATADRSTALYWIDAYGRTWRGHEAIGHALMLCKRPLPILGWLVLVPPISWLAAAAHLVVARSRRRPGSGRATRSPGAAPGTFVVRAAKEAAPTR
jgi:predicted DCC family thiol-disulfide oxidoreductase YuxK